LPECNTKSDIALDRIRGQMKFSMLAKPNRHYWLFFLAVTLFYLSLSPGTIEGMGYARENLIAADQIAANLGNLLSGRPMTPIEWTRHGCLEPILELPFVAASRLLFGPSIKWAGRLTALQPILATAWLCALIFVWARRVSGSLVWSYALASVAAFATMLWPYAYIGMETTQSAFLLYAGYLSLGRKPRRSWAETLLFAVACALAVSVKLNGIFLLPAVGFLVWSYFQPASSQEGKQDGGSTGGRLTKALAVAMVVIAIHGANHFAKSSYWSKDASSSTGYFFHWLADNPLTMALQAFAYFGSPNKSILIHAPVVALSLAALPRAYRAHPRLAIFAVLALAGLAGGFSLIHMWAEETWGPRYLHAAIAPLVVALAATKAGVRFNWRAEAPLLALASAGLAVSFLGAFFPYPPLHVAAMRSGQSTLEALQYDLRWNHVRFNLKLLQIWAHGRVSSNIEPQPWPPALHWWFERPPDTPPEKTVDLREMASPQPMLAQGWNEQKPIPRRAYQILRLLCLACFVFGIGLWAWVGRFSNACDVSVARP
jgi:hypothetical protein